MAQVLKGKPVADAILNEVSVDVVDLKQQGIYPMLACVRIGDNEDDKAYARGIAKAASKVGIEIREFNFAEDVCQSELEDVIGQINLDEGIHGCLMFRPFPKGVDEAYLINLIAPEKDVDGSGSMSLAGIFTGAKVGFAPATAEACIKVLDYYKFDLSGKRAVVIGRSLVIGRPIAMLLLERDATVTIAHSRSQNLDQITREADIVVCATGRVESFGESHFCEGQYVLDVGIGTTSDGRLAGDVAYDEVEPIAGAISPVPGGIGSVTSAVMMEHVVKAAKLVSHN